MLEKYEVCCGLFHGFDWSKWTTGTPQERLGLLPAAQEHILAQENGKERCCAPCASCRRRSRWRCRTRGAAHPRRRGVLPGGAGGARQARARRRAARGGLDHAVRQIISRAWRRRA
jgi:type I restriction enzyme, R subunit